MSVCDPFESLVNVRFEEGHHWQNGSAAVRFMGIRALISSCPSFPGIALAKRAQTECGIEFLDLLHCSLNPRHW
jgi:hypothetical protein